MIQYWWMLNFSIACHWGYRDNHQQRRYHDHHQQRLSNGMNNFGDIRYLWTLFLSPWDQQSLGTKSKSLGSSSKFHPKRTLQAIIADISPGIKVMVAQIWPKDIVNWSTLYFPVRPNGLRTKTHNGCSKFHTQPTQRTLASNNRWPINRQGEKSWWFKVGRRMTFNPLYNPVRLIVA